MMRLWMKVGAGLVLAWSLAMTAPPASPQEAQPPKPCYTRQEYDVFNAAANEQNIQQRLKLLDEFVAKFPNACADLMVPAYQKYLEGYNGLRNLPKVIEYADKLLSFSDRLDASGKISPLYHRTLAYNSLPYNDKDPAARGQAQKAHDAALQGLQALSALPKPENISAEDFEKGKVGPKTLFNYTAGITAMRLKNFKDAVESFKAAIAVDPAGGAVTYFQMGVAYLQMDPPEYMNGFWALARSIALKGPSEAQVRTYLRAQMLRYQQPSCDKLLDAEMNELLTLAAGSADRPASYRIPSLAELEAAQKTMTVLTVMSDLKAGGDKAKLVWLAACGLEFPDVPGKLIEVVPAADSVILKLFLSGNEEEAQAATTPNMEVKVAGQPEVARLEKDDVPHFTGTLASYDPEPFMLHWEKGKVNPDDIPAVKTPAGKQPAKKAPAKRPPVKKPGA